MKKKGPSAAEYEDCVIAYLDILGFRDLVKRNKVEVILEAMKIIRRRLRHLDRFPNSGLRYTMFSDLVVFSARKADEGLLAVVHVAAYLAADLMHKGILCRGAITTGRLHHRGDVIFGPALVEAFDLERQLALYPRIVIGWNLADEFVTERNRDRPKSRRLGFGLYFRHDFDQQYHVDVLSPWVSKPPRSGLVSKTVVRPIRARLMREIGGSDTIEGQRKQAKISWLFDYLDYVEEAHGPTRFG